MDGMVDGLVSALNKCDNQRESEAKLTHPFLSPYPGFTKLCEVFFSNMEIRRLRKVFIYSVRRTPSYLIPGICETFMP